MKVTMKKQEVIELVKDHLPIPAGFRIADTHWDSYSDLEIEIEVIPPRLSMDKPLFPPQRPCVVDSPGSDGDFAGVSVGGSPREEPL